jgi:hypothetical protein
MLTDHQRRLEIGSHRERLDTVKALGELHSREAYGLLKLATEDIDPQIRELAEKLMRDSCWYSGSGSSSTNTPSTSERDHESLF